MVILIFLARLLALFLLWPLFLGLRESLYTLFLIMAWWITILVVFGRVVTAI